jgi:hypothetical protein
MYIQEVLSVSYLKEPNGFSSNFILEGYIRSCQANFILVHVCLISCNPYSRANSYKIYTFSQKQLIIQTFGTWHNISLRPTIFIWKFLYLVDMWWNTRKIIMTLTDVISIVWLVLQHWICKRVHIQEYSCYELYEWSRCPVSILKFESGNSHTGSRSATHSTMMFGDTHVLCPILYYYEHFKSHSLVVFSCCNQVQ